MLLIGILVFFISFFILACLVHKTEKEKAYEDIEQNVWIEKYIKEKNK